MRRTTRVYVEAVRDALALHDGAEDRLGRRRAADVAQAHKPHAGLAGGRLDEAEGGSGCLRDQVC